MARHVLDAVDSTNAHALRLAPDHPAPAWVLGLTQSAGRGRRARAWASPRENFHATHLSHPDAPPGDVALRSFAAALALREALVAVTGLAAGFALKWPNDVLLDGAKLAGILLESVGQGARVAHLAVGFGVNLVAAPPQAALEPGALPAISLLAATGLRVAPGVLLDALAPAYAQQEARLAAHGFAPLREDWLTHAVRLGQHLRARTGQAEFEGIFETIDLQGNLILRMKGETRAIPAAEVFF